MSCSSTFAARGRSGAQAGSQAHIRVEPEPMAVRTARRFVAGQLAGQTADTVDNACLLTSELVTNAIVHAGSSVVVGVALDADEILVTVSDERHDRVPRIGRMPAAADVVEMSRGIALVRTVARDFGWHMVTEGSGKVVWFSLDAAARSPVPA